MAHLLISGATAIKPILEVNRLKPQQNQYLLTGIGYCSFQAMLLAILAQEANVEYVTEHLYSSKADWL